MNTPTFGFAVTQKASSSIVCLSGEIDYAASLEIMPRLEHLARDCPGELLFDLRRVTLIDSEGLKMLLRVFDRMLSKGCRARITGMSERASQVIGMAGLGDVLGCQGQITHARQVPWRIPGPTRNRRV